MSLATVPATARPTMYTTSYVGERVGLNSYWHVIGCQPDKSLTLYYDDARNHVVQTVYSGCVAELWFN